MARLFFPLIKLLLFLPPNLLTFPLLADQYINLEAETSWYNSTHIYWHLLPIKNDARCCGRHKRVYDFALALQNLCPGRERYFRSKN